MVHLTFIVVMRHGTGSFPLLVKDGVWGRLWTTSLMSWIAYITR